MLHCHYTCARIPALINRELSPQTRRFVARHIDCCAACRAEYNRQKNMQGELSRALPRFGQPDPETLHRIWMRVQQPQPLRLRPLPSRLKPYSWGGFLMGVLLIALMPLSDGGHHPTLPQQPAPKIQGITPTPARAASPADDAAPTRILMLAETTIGADTWQLLDNTPAPPATDVP